MDYTASIQNILFLKSIVYVEETSKMISTQLKEQQSEVRFKYYTQSALAKH